MKVLMKKKNDQGQNDEKREIIKKQAEYIKDLTKKLKVSESLVQSMLTQLSSIQKTVSSKLEPKEEVENDPEKQQKRDEANEKRKLKEREIEDLRALNIQLQKDVLLH